MRTKKPRDLEGLQNFKNWDFRRSWERNHDLLAARKGRIHGQWGKCSSPIKPVNFAPAYPRRILQYAVYRDKPSNWSTLDDPWEVAGRLRGDLARWLGGKDGEVALGSFEAMRVHPAMLEIWIMIGGEFGTFEQGTRKTKMSCSGFLTLTWPRRMMCIESQPSPSTLSDSAARRPSNSIPHLVRKWYEMEGKPLWSCVA